MKHLKHLLVFVIIAIHIRLNEASYKPNIKVLIDKNLDYKNENIFPTDCSNLDCPICCGGVPPSCSDDGLTCSLKENTSFTKLY